MFRTIWSRHFHLAQRKLNSHLSYVIVKHHCRRIISVRGVRWSRLSFPFLNTEKLGQLVDAGAGELFPRDHPFIKIYPLRFSSRREESRGQFVRFQSTHNKVLIGTARYFFQRPPAAHLRNNALVLRAKDRTYRKATVRGVERVYETPGSYLSHICSRSGLNSCVIGIVD